MEIPVVKRSQRLGYEQGGAPNDIGLAATKGRAIASLAETAGKTALEYYKFENMAKNAARANECNKTKASRPPTALYRRDFRVSAQRQ